MMPAHATTTLHEKRRLPMTAAVWLGSPQAASHFDLNALSDAEQQRYAGLRGASRRAEFAVSRALRARALEGFEGVSSLSHSGGWAAVARAAPERRIGVDIEWFKSRDVLRLARFAFDPVEIAALEALEDEPRRQMFYALWTLKESMAKALGVPLLTATRQCVFQVQDGKWQGTAPIDEPWYALSFLPHADMALAVVVIGAVSQPLVRTFDWPPEQPTSWAPVAAIQVGGGSHRV